MKKTVISAAIVCLLFSSMLTTPSCIGLNELVFFAFWVLPVYEVCALADVVVLNSIEFWSGSNPMAKGERMIEGQDGKYLVRCDGKGYDIISCNDGSSVRLDFDQAEQTWSFEANGERHMLFQFFDISGNPVFPFLS